MTHASASPRADHCHLPWLQGAGGNCNVVKEIIYPLGAEIDVRAIKLGDQTLRCVGWMQRAVKELGWVFVCWGERGWVPARDRAPGCQCPACPSGHLPFIPACILPCPPFFPAPPACRAHGAQRPADLFPLRVSPPLPCACSVLEIWGAEYQENDALLIKPEARPVLEAICARERCIMQVRLEGG